MAEVMVAAGLVGIIGLGVMNLAGQLGTVQKRGRNFLEKNDFVSTLTRYLYSGNGCADIVGQSFTSTPSIINLPNWKYLTATGLTQGNKVENIELRRFRATQNLAADLPRVQVSGETLIKTSLDIEVRIRQEGKISNHYFSLPVLSRSSGEVVLCNDNKNAAEVCNAMLGSYNASTNTCEVANSCLLKGTYKTLTCTPVHETGCSMDYGGDEVNQYTGATSCPTGSTPSQTGIINWNHSVSCGKKCTLTIKNTATWFTCLECP